MNCKWAAPKRILGFTLLLAGLALCGAGLWLLLSPAQYQATVRIIVESDAPDMSRSGQVSYDPYFIQTEFEVIQSPLVLSNVVAALNLNAEWGKKHGDGSPLKTATAIKLLQWRMRLEPVRNTRFLKISFSSEDPSEAAKIVNAIAKAYQDYRLEKREQLRLKGIQVLTEQFQQDEQAIKAEQEKLEQLRKQLCVPNPEPVDELLKSNYPSYFQAKRKLEGMTNFHKVLAAKIESEKSGLWIPKTTMVQIVDPAVPPKWPAGPNRSLGVALLVVGLSSIIVGWLVLKSSGRSPT